MAKNRPLKLLIKDDTRTLLEADVGNELIEALNRLLTSRVQFVTAGSSEIRSSADEAYIAINIADVIAAKLRNKSGFAAPAGTADRTSFNTATVTVEQLARRMKALIEDVYGL